MDATWRGMYRRPFGFRRRVPSRGECGSSSYNGPLLALAGREASFRVGKGRGAVNACSGLVRAPLADASVQEDLPAVHQTFGRGKHAQRKPRAAKARQGFPRPGSRASPELLA